MKIETSNKTTIIRICVGECFKYCSDIYIKTDRLKYDVNATLLIGVVNLITGAFKWLINDEVTQLKVKVVIENDR